MAALLVDTSVWSLAFRRDAPVRGPEVLALQTALAEGDDVFTCGMVLLELLRGLLPGRTREAISAAFESLGWIEPGRADYEAAAGVANVCRSHGIQLGSVDALIAHLAIQRDLTLLTTDRDFLHAADCVPFRVWSPA